MKQESSFKYVFFALAVMAVVLIAGLIVSGYSSLRDVHDLVPIVSPMTSMAMLMALLVAAFLIAAAIASYVYHDARKRGLDPWLWATVAAFIPYFIGLIIYLVMRKSARHRCAKCGRSLQSDFSNCPYCGEPATLKCGKCGLAIAPDWKVCPRCTSPLNGSEK